MARSHSRKTRQRQGELPFRAWGGPRPGAGRKRVGERPGVPHRERQPLASRFPVHVTLRLREGLPSLRNKRVFAVVRTALAGSCERADFRIIHFSVQTNHIHLIVEARDQRALTLGLQGLMIRTARALNRLWRRKGRVFADRYHAEVLRTPRQVRNALSYVLHNARKHGRRLPSFLDPFATGFWFDGWKEAITVRGLDRRARPIAAARTWLLRIGWRRHGRIGLTEEPVRGGTRL